MCDGDEVRRYFTTPGHPDTDLDGIPDGRELGLSGGALGLNSYNESWYTDIDRTAIYLAEIDTWLDARPSFQPDASGLRTDPRSYDTDHDGEWDLAELDAMSDPGRGIMRHADVASEDFAETGAFEHGLSPLIPGSYDLYMRPVDLNEGEGEPEYGWSATFPVSLGLANSVPLVLSSNPPGKALFRASDDGEWVESLAVTTDAFDPVTERAMVEMRTTTLFTGSFEVTLEDPLEGVTRTHAAKYDTMAFDGSMLFGGGAGLPVPGAGSGIVVWNERPGAWLDPKWNPERKFAAIAVAGALSGQGFVSRSTLPPGVPGPIDEESGEYIWCASWFNTGMEVFLTAAGFIPTCWRRRLS